MLRTRKDLFFPNEESVYVNSLNHTFDLSLNVKGCIIYFIFVSFWCWAGIRNKVQNLTTYDTKPMSQKHHNSPRKLEPGCPQTPTTQGLSQ